VTSSWGRPPASFTCHDSPHSGPAPPGPGPARPASVPNCIPIRYHHGMTIQIAVRLPDDLVAFVDEQVSSGAAPSRAAVVFRALEHERRRNAAERDAAIYAATGSGDLDDLATWAAKRPMDID
jgi:Arc/MetJ-type ribon-helix-helix transcriptional regulator